MRALVVYESMFGNTRLIAEAVGEGLATLFPVEVVNVNRVAQEQPGSVDLLVVGGPTHIHGMSRQASRDSARGQVTDKLPLEADAPGIGVREWIATLQTSATFCAAFDTRVDMAAWITGAASVPIERLLRQHGLRPVSGPASFLVTDETRLEAGEIARARAWGVQLATAALRVAEAWA